MEALRPSQVPLPLAARAWIQDAIRERSAEAARDAETPARYRCRLIVEEDRQLAYAATTAGGLLPLEIGELQCLRGQAYSGGR